MFSAQFSASVFLLLFSSRLCRAKNLNNNTTRPAGTGAVRRRVCKTLAVRKYALVKGQKLRVTLCQLQSESETRHAALPGRLLSGLVVSDLHIHPDLFVMVRSNLKDMITEPIGRLDWSEVLVSGPCQTGDS